MRLFLILASGIHLALFPLLVSATSVFLAAMLFVAGAMMLTTTVGLRLTLEGFGSGATGLILTCQAIGFVVGTQIGPALIRRVGHIRVFSAFAALICTAALLHGAVVDGLLWGALRFVAGMCGSVMLVVIESWISAHANPGARGRVMGIYMIVYYASGAGGQFLVGVSPPSDYRSFSLAAGLLVLSLVPLAMTGLAAPAVANTGRMGLVALYRVSPIATAGAFAAGFCLSSFYQLAPVSMARLGAEIPTVARYMGCAVFASMLLQFPMGRMADRWDRRKLIACIAVAASVSASIVASVGTLSLAALFAATILFMALMASLYPTCLGQMHNRLQGANPVAANAGQLLCYGLGTCIGPLACGLVMAAVGPSGLFLAVAVVLAAYAAFVAWRLRVIAEAREPATGMAQSVMVMGESTPVMAQMDPRTQGEVLP